MELVSQRPPNDLFIPISSPVLKGEKLSDLLRLTVELQAWGEIAWGRVKAIDDYYKEMEK